MIKDRCPWCGKIINRYSDQRMVVKKATPMNLRFARCSHCHNYYGQSLNSKKAVFCFLGICLLIISGFILENIFIAFLSVVLVLALILTPLKRMDENEKTTVYENQKLKAILLESYCKIHPHKYYFLTNNFDDCECFSVVSPIYICSLNRKSKEMLVSFMYENSQNIDYANRSDVNIYDSKMRLVAKISFKAR